jgi:hypothetical protein
VHCEDQYDHHGQNQSEAFTANAIPVSQQLIKIQFRRQQEPKKMAKQRLTTNQQNHA